MTANDHPGQTEFAIRELPDSDNSTNWPGRMLSPSEVYQTAIDMALWDLKGKSLGLSVSELMGGRYRDSFPCFATGMCFKDMSEDALLDSIVAKAVGYREQGFKAMKIKVDKNKAFDARQIAAMREALPDKMLMADFNHAYDSPEAICIGHVLDEYDFAWFEEPFSPEYESQFRQLHDKVNVPIATGSVCVDEVHYAVQLPHGGVKKSGIGKDCLRYSLQEYLRLKRVNVYILIDRPNYRRREWNG